MGTFTHDITCIVCIHYLAHSQKIGHSKWILQRFSVNTETVPAAPAQVTSYAGRCLLFTASFKIQWGEEPSDLEQLSGVCAAGVADLIRHRERPERCSSWLVDQAEGQQVNKGVDWWICRLRAIRQSWHWCLLWCEKSVSCGGRWV